MNSFRRFDSQPFYISILSYLWFCITISAFIADIYQSIHSIVFIIHFSLNVSIKIYSLVYLSYANILEYLRVILSC